MAVMTEMPPCEQNPEELDWMLERIGGFNSVLEIGSRQGGTLVSMAGVCKFEAKVRSIDVDVCDRLKGTLDFLNKNGYDAAVFEGDSHSQEAIDWAAKHSPYDFIFIDGDHTYEGVTADLGNYGPLATKAIGLHDIKHQHWGVKDAWARIKEMGQKTEEYVAFGSYLGIGIWWLG